MYPFLRLGWQFLEHRRTRYGALTDVHVSRHICWPWDLDPWMELNNGRTLTLYDLGRVPFAARLGLVAALRRAGCGLTVAGSSTRYRRRIRAFDRITMRSRLVGWDARFLYIEQAMWLRGSCAGHVLIRGAIVGPDGIVAGQDAAADRIRRPPGAAAGLGRRVDRRRRPAPLAADGRRRGRRMTRPDDAAGGAPGDATGASPRGITPGAILTKAPLPACRPRGFRS